MYSACKADKNVQLHSVLTFFNCLLEKDHYFSGETHDFWEIVCVLSGKVGITAGKDVYLLEGGNAVVHEPLEFHSIWSESGTAPEVVIFSFYAEKMPETDGRLFNLNTEVTERLRRLALKAKTVFSYENSQIEITNVLHGKERDASLIFTELESLIQMILMEKKANLSVHQSQSAKNYMNVLAVLEDNLYKKLTVSEIAKLCNTSESNLKKIFFKYANRGVMNYFNTIKIKKAAELIGAGMAIKEAANLLGFTDQNYFSTVFKRVTGVSPAKYK
ncbi:MAG: AraC family transcriptional regulator [Clostridia bacterium]|nr:AraC family transcriptional regulator [Clostridia bacterium]